MLIQRWAKIAKDQRPQVELAIVANRIISINKRENASYDNSKQMAKNVEEFKTYWIQFKEYSLERYKSNIY